MPNLILIEKPKNMMPFEMFFELFKANVSKLEGKLIYNINIYADGTKLAVGCTSVDGKSKELIGLEIIEKKNEDNQNPN